MAINAGPDLSFHGIRARIHKGLDFEVLFQILKEDLNLPAVFTKKPENCQIDIYTNTNMPDRPMKEIGICFGKAPGGGLISANTPEAVNQLKKCACKNGGDAIVLNPPGGSGVFTRARYSQKIVQANGKVYRYK